MYIGSVLGKAILTSPKAGKISDTGEFIYEKVNFCYNSLDSYNGYTAIIYPTIGYIKIVESGTNREIEEIFLFEVEEFQEEILEQIEYSRQYG